MVGVMLILCSVPRVFRAGLRSAGFFAISFNLRLMVGLLRVVYAPIKPRIVVIAGIGNPCDAKQLAVTLSAQAKKIRWPLHTIRRGERNVKRHYYSVNELVAHGI